MSELELHPTAKPVRMLADAIKDVTARNGIVLDVFGGDHNAVKAPDARAAETAAVAQFKLDEEQRKRLAVREQD
jgi:hypothetical protein